MSELWKDIPGYEGIYQASTFGNIRITNYRKSGLPKLKLQIRDKDGIQKSCRVNRLIAKTFLPSFSEALQVNHKDENKENNAVENLECLTPIQNSNYGTRNFRLGMTKLNQRGKRVKQFDLNGNFIKEWRSICEIQRSCGFDISAIIRCCKQRQETSYGYKWEYA